MSLPCYYETTFIEIESHSGLKIRNWRKSVFFFKESGSKSVILCFQHVQMREITPDKFESIIKYKIWPMWGFQHAKKHETGVSWTKLMDFMFKTLAKINLTDDFVYIWTLFAGHTIPDDVFQLLWCYLPPSVRVGSIEAQISCRFLWKNRFL